MKSRVREMNIVVVVVVVVVVVHTEREARATRVRPGTYALYASYRQWYSYTYWQGCTPGRRLTRGRGGKGQLSRSKEKTPRGSQLRYPGYALIMPPR